VKAGEFIEIFVDAPNLADRVAAESESRFNGIRI